MTNNYVCVIYDELQSASTAIDGIREDINNTVIQMQTIKNEMEKVNDKHGAFSESIEKISELEKNFQNYNVAFEYLKTQCDATYNAFHDAENKNEKEMEKQLAEWTSLIGLTEKISPSDVQAMSREKYNELKSDDELKKYMQEKTNAKTTTGIFDSVLRRTEDGKTNAKDGEEAETVVDKNKDKDKTTTKSQENTGTGASGTGTTATTTTSSPNYKSVTNTQQSTDQTQKTGEPQFRKIETATSDTNKKTDTPNTIKTNEKEEGIVEVNVKPKTDDKTTSSDTNTTTKEVVNEKETTTNPKCQSETNTTQQSTETQSTTPETQTTSPETTTNNDQHTGATYSEENGYQPSYEYETNDSSGFETPEPALETEESVPVQNTETSVEDIVRGNKYSKIPRSSEIIAPKTPTKSSGGNSFIPITAGISAAAAAGIGAKAFLDRKKNSDNDMFEDNNWDEDDSIDISTDDTSKEELLTDEDTYSYNSEKTEKYGAKNNEELADIQ